MRRALVLIVGALLIAAATTPSGAAPPRLQRLLLVYSYDGMGPALLSAEGVVEADGRPGYFATVVADVDQDGRMRPFFPDVLELGEGTPTEVYGAAGSHDLCAAAAVTCTRSAGASKLGFGISFNVSRSPRPVHIRLFVAMEGTRVEANQVMLGWKVSKRTTGVTRTGGGGNGVRAFGGAVEALPEATLRGGRRGSIAVAVPPCEDLGAGTVTLTGGRSPDPVLCPSYAFADAAPGTTRWSLSGTAAGVSTTRTRLLVIDL